MLNRILKAFATLLLGAAPAAAQETAEAWLGPRIEEEGRLAAAGDALRQGDAVRQVYRSGGARLLWWGRSGLLPAAGELRREIAGARRHALRPTDYHARTLDRLLDPARTARGLTGRQQAEADLLLTDAFLALGRDLVRGRAGPHSVHRGWTLAGRDADPAALLPDAVRRGRVSEALAALAPATPHYARLQGALDRYRRMTPWPRLPRRALTPGDSGAEVVALRERLAAEGIVAPSADPRYDVGLAQVVRIVQRRHGLGDDAVIGPATRAALDVPLEQRTRQLEASLERERWLPPSLGGRYVAVYLPEFVLRAVEEERPPLEMRVIAGKPSWRTPIFSAEMTAAVFNPYWNIPPSIWRQEVGPRARRDPGYLAREGIHPVSDGGAVRWRQSPGPQNPLGEVKLVFPNPYNVYLHDTSAPSLFQQQPVRAFSHGCIRVEKPLELVAFALARNPGWGADEIAAEARRNSERTVRLSERIPVHVLYRTAWVDDSGAAHFREDLYGHDRALARALGSGEPTAPRGRGERPAADGEAAP